MTRFPNLLDQFLIAHKDQFTAETFADKSSVHSGDLSRVRSGSKIPTKDFMNKILTSPLLPLPDALHLTVAYLRDVTPVMMETYLSITVVDRSIASGETSDLLSEALEYFRQAARSDAETYAWITGLYKTLAGRR